MSWFRLLAVTAAAATVAGIAVPASVAAAPKDAAKGPAAQAFRSAGGQHSGLVRYPDGQIARIARPKLAATGRIEGVRDAARTGTTQTSPVVTAADVPPADRGTIRGRITDREHHPLAAADVYVSVGDAGQSAHVMTDSTGRYSVSVPAGHHYLGFHGEHATGGDADATGYAPVFKQVDLAPGGSVRTNARLAAGAQVHVRVADSGDRPLAGVLTYLGLVLPYVRGPNSIGLFVDYGTDDVTATDGTFTYRGVPSDASFVCFSTYRAQPSGGSHDLTGYRSRCARRPIAPAPGSTTDLPTVHLMAASGGAVAGVVTGLGGRPVAGVGVLADSGRDGEYGPTAADGSYRITGLKPGEYRVCFTTDGASGAHLLGYAGRCEPRRVRVRRGQASALDFRLHRGAAITGSVLGATGAPVAGAEVNGYGGGDEFAFAVTDAGGHYRLKGLRSGRYEVCADAFVAVDPGSPSGDRPGCYRHKAKVPVRAGSVRGHTDVQLHLGGALAGRVVDRNGAGVPDVDVEIDARTGRDVVDTLVSTDANGRYRFPGVPAGSYTVCLRQLDLGSASESEYCQHGPVEIRTGRTTHLDGVFGPPASTGSIRVAVRDDEGHRVQGIDVVVLAQCAKRNPDSCPSVPVFGHAGTAAVADSRMVGTAGTATSVGLKPGDYAVCLFTYFGVTAAGAPPDGYVDRCAGRTFTVAVTTGGTARVHLRVHPAGRVVGRVVDASGHPVPHVLVDVSNSAATDFNDPFGYVHPDEWPPLADAITNEDGTFSIPGVQPGTQKICLRARRVGPMPRKHCLADSITVTANATTNLPDIVVHHPPGG